MKTVNPYLTLIVEETREMSRLRPMTAVVRLAIGIALGLGAIVLLQGCTGGRDVDASSATAATPQDAVAAFVQARGDRFAGACESTRSPEDIGKVCARLIDERDGLQAYLIGRTFSEFSTWVFVGQQDGGWAVVATTPLDFHDMTMTIPWPE